MSVITTRSGRRHHGLLGLAWPLATSGHADEQFEEAGYGARYGLEVFTCVGWPVPFDGFPRAEQVRVPGFSAWCAYCGDVAAAVRAAELLGVRDAQLFQLGNRPPARLGFGVELRVGDVTLVAVQGFEKHPNRPPVQRGHLAGTPRERQHAHRGSTA